MAPAWESLKLSTSLEMEAATVAMLYLCPQASAPRFHSMRICPFAALQGKGFGQVDEILLGNLADQATCKMPARLTFSSFLKCTAVSLQVSVALHNAEFYRAAIVTSERANVTQLQKASA